MRNQTDPNGLYLPNQWTNPPMFPLQANVFFLLQKSWTIQILIQAAKGVGHAIALEDDCNQPAERQVEAKKHRQYLRIAYWYWKLTCSVYQECTKKTINMHKCVNTKRKGTITYSGLWFNYSTLRQRDISVGGGNTKMNSFKFKQTNAWKHAYKQMYWMQI